MSKRSKTRSSGGSMLKFSNTSVTSARASHARGSIDLTDYQNGGLKRRKFFNSSTELSNILGLMLMSLCRQVTSLSYLKRRLMVYCGMVLIGGFLHDFVPFLPRALFLQWVSPSHPFNWLFVKFGMAWNIAVLLPLIALSSYALNSLVDIELDKIEKSIEQYHDRRLAQLLSSQSRPSVSSQPGASFGQAKTIVSLQSLSNSAPLKMVEQYQKRILNSEKDCREMRRFSFNWFLESFRQALLMVCTKDVCRLFLSGALFAFSVMSFHYLQSTTTPRSVSKSSGNALAASSRQTERPDVKAASGGLDISGHVFILIFSNLMFLEECNIMTGWEPLGDRLYDLSREYMNLELDTWSGPLGLQLGEMTSGPATEVNRVLFLAWHRFSLSTVKVRVAFFGVTLLCLLWDLMLVQTAFFYHSMIEKMIAFIWAIACWFIAYRILFPFLSIEVKKPLTSLGENAKG